MLDDAAQYTFKGQTFATKEDMERHMQQRAAVAVKKSTDGPSFGMVMAGLAAMFIVTCSYHGLQPAPTTQAEPVRTASADSKTVLAA